METSENSTDLSTGTEDLISDRIQSGQQPDHDYTPPEPHLAPKLARAIVVVVSCALGTMSYLQVVWLDLGLGPNVLGAACITGVLLLQLFYFNRAREELRTPRGYAVLAAQAGLVYLPVFQYQTPWLAMGGFLGGSVLLVLPFRAALPTFIGIVTSITAIQALFSEDFLQIVYTMLSTVITGLVIYGLSRLAALVVEVHRARTDLARLAVAQERLRFARDLHDLLGYSLSAITLKSELAHRLLTNAPERAQEQLEEVLGITRNALADVRAVASDQRTLSLDQEVRSVQSIFASADVESHMNLEYQDIPEQIGTVLATILREGVTNVLRHSKAEHCAITIRQDADTVSLVLVNDGARFTRKDRKQHGGGTLNLAERVAALGGTFTAGHIEDTRFELAVTLPLNDRREHAE